MTNYNCYCGHDCSRCKVYLATTTKNETLLMESKAYYENLLQYEIDPCDLICYGGRSDTICYLCEDCPFAECCERKGIAFCKDCDEYPCKLLADYEAEFVNKSNQVSE